MENAKNITQIIIETINTILQNLFSSIDNNLYEILDDIIFINPDIIFDSFFEKILGTNSHNGIILICNSLLFGFILYYSIKYLFSHLSFIKDAYDFAITRCGDDAVSRFDRYGFSKDFCCKCIVCDLIIWNDLSIYRSI